MRKFWNCSALIRDFALRIAHHRRENFSCTVNNPFPSPLTKIRNLKPKRKLIHIYRLYETKIERFWNVKAKVNCFCLKHNSMGLILFQVRSLSWQGVFFEVIEFSLRTSFDMTSPTRYRSWHELSLDHVHPSDLCCYRRGERALYTD